MSVSIIVIFKPYNFQIIKGSPSENRLKRINIRGSIRQGNSSGRFYVKYLEPNFEKFGGYLFKTYNMGDDALGYRYFYIPDESTKRKNGDYFQGIPTNRDDILEIPYPNYFDMVDEFNRTGYEGPKYFGTGKKPETFIKKIIEISNCKTKEIIIDFFLGSGTTTAVAHKLGRKWIGVEMGEHFWTVVLPRMKKVLFYDKSGISKEKDVKEIYNPKTAGGFFKYQYLGQYEDTLNNIIFAGEEGRQAKLLEFKDYIFHILDYGTRGSMSRLNIDQFKKPFDYKMEILENGIPKDTNVDLVETFNYLLGLHIKKIYTEDTNGRKYIWVVGERRDKSLVVVVWRDSEELDLVQDRKYIEDKLNEISVVEPDHIYVNGDSYVQNAIPIETEFMKFVGV